MSQQRDLFANFERMRREIDELFGDVFERQTGLRGRGFSPSVDVFYSDDPPRAMVKADLAGVDIADVALEIRGRQLLITGSAAPQRQPAASTSRSRSSTGRSAGSWSWARRWWQRRREASYEDGILAVEIPLAQPDQSVRRVPIQDPEP